MEVYVMIAEDDVGRAPFAFRTLEDLKVHLADAQELPQIVIQELAEQLEREDEADFSLDAATTDSPTDWNTMLTEEEQEAFLNFTMVLYRMDMD